MSLLFKDFQRHSRLLPPLGRLPPPDLHEGVSDDPPLLLGVGDGVQGEGVALLQLTLGGLVRNQGLRRVELLRCLHHWEGGGGGGGGEGETSASPSKLFAYFRKCTD